MRKIIKYTIFSLIFLLFNYDSMAGCGENANPAIRTMCEVIIFLQGRIGRALVTLIIVFSAWNFANGGLKWENILSLMIGIGLFWAPKTFALVILPDYVSGIYGAGYTPDQKLTPDDIISCACPDLR